MKIFSHIDYYINEIYGFSFDDIPERYHQMLALIVDEEFYNQCIEFVEYGIYSQDDSSLMNGLLRKKRISAQKFISDEFKLTWKTEALQEWLKT